MEKIFPHTFDGDQIRIEFGYREERVAFERAVELLKQRVAQNKERQTPIEDFKFETTLQAEVAGEHVEAIKKIVGLMTFNMCVDHYLYIIPLPGSK